MKLSSDKSLYQIGDRAILTAKLLIAPTNSSQEFFLDASLNSQPIKISSQDGITYYSTSPKIQSVGEHSWEVNLYLQDKRQARTLMEAIENLKNEIAKIEKELDSETDPDERVVLFRKMQQKEKDILLLKDQLVKLRVKVGAGYSLVFTTE